MQLSVNVTLPHILDLIGQMSLEELEKVKENIITREIYFKKFKKDKIENIMNDFKQENYSDDFLKTLEDGLKKSSPYNANL